MIETKYICDRCKAEQPTAEQFWKVGIQVHTINSQPRPYDTGPTAQWCRECVEDMGILPTFKEGKVVDPKPTLEDMIREIVREEEK